MNRKYKLSSDVPTDKLCDRLEELSDAVTRGKDGDHEFTMSIPPQLDRDADLVLQEAASRLREFDELKETVRLQSSEIDALLRLVDRLEADVS